MTKYIVRERAIIMSIFFVTNLFRCYTEAKMSSKDDKTVNIYSAIFITTSYAIQFCIFLYMVCTFVSTLQFFIKFKKAMMRSKR